jgi:hypothetical protein
MLLSFECCLCLWWGCLFEGGVVGLRCGGYGIVLLSVDAPVRCVSIIIIDFFKA